MDETTPVAELVQRLRAGDSRAAETLFHRYARRLSRLAGQHLSRKLAGRIDGEDVVQSVFRTFFRRHAEGEFRIEGDAQLWRLLVKITVLKTRAKGRAHTAAMRDATAEVAGPDAWLAESLAEEPGPEQAVALVDQIEALLRCLPEMYGRVLELRMQGHAVAEIAPQLQVSRRTVYRALDLLQERLLQGGGDEAP
jgi:RNA polymerase sigma-70 factor (ECF subfamily)